MDELSVSFRERELCFFIHTKNVPIEEYSNSRPRWTWIKLDKWQISGYHGYRQGNLSVNVSWPDCWLLPLPFSNFSLFKITLRKVDWTVLDFSGR